MAKQKEKDDIRVTAIVSKEELEAVKTLSESDGRTVSAYVRRLVQADIDAAEKDGRMKKAKAKS